MIKYIIIFITIAFYSLSGNSQTLEEYFKTAAENNPGLQAKYKEFEAAMQKVPQVSALPDPSFSFGYFVSPVETRVGPQRAKLSLNQMFPWFGTLDARRNAAALTAKAKYQSFLDERNKLYYQVSEAYYPLYELEEWKNIEQENIEILKSYKSIATSKFKNGSGPMVDILRIDIILKEAETNLLILDQKEKPLITTFNNLLNRDENEEVIIKDTLIIDFLPENFRRDSLLENNPVLTALDLKIEAGKAAEIAAGKQGLPKLGIGLDYAIVGKREGIDLPDNGKNILMPMVSVSIPIFRKKYDASVKESQIMQENYSLQKDNYINILKTNYENASFRIRQQRDLISQYQKQIEESDQALNLLFSAYSNSGKDFEEVLGMEQQLLKYEKMKATAEVQYQIAVARLNYLTSKTY